MHNGFDDWDFEERFSTNGDELYEIESNYYMEQEDFHAQQGTYTDAKMYILCIFTFIHTIYIFFICMENYK